MARTLRQRIGKRRPFESPHEEAYLNILLTASTLEAGPDRVLKERQLTQPSYNVLRILAGEGRPLSCAEIRERMVARVPDVTRLIDRLVERGLVHRERSAEDRRIVTAAITGAGRDAIAGLDRKLRRVHEEQLNSLDAPELHQLSRLLEKARASHEAPRGKRAPGSGSDSDSSPNTSSDIGPSTSCDIGPGSGSATR